MREPERQAAPRAWEDPLFHVVWADEAPAPQLVAGVNQNLFRGVLHGALHEAGAGGWFQRAVVREGVSYGYHQLLPAALRWLDGVSEEERLAFARLPTPGELATWVSALYSLYRRVLPRAPGPEREAPPPQARLGCALPRAVRQLSRAFGGREGLQLYLHGSLATCDTTPYSDVDTLLLVEHEWLERPEALAELRHVVRSAQRWLYAYDPTQHHGFMVVTALDLERYAPHYFPLELLQFAYPLTPARTVRYRCRAAFEESYAIFRGVCRRLQRLCEGTDPWPGSRYALKLVLSEAMLIPSYFLQLTGRVLYKRDSFGVVRSLLSVRAQRAMDALSAWRVEWRRSGWDRLYRMAGPFLPDPLARRALGRARSCRLSRVEMDRWRRLLPDLRRLAEELLGQVPLAAS
jgi:hypothetical protein